MGKDQGVKHVFWHPGLISVKPKGIHFDLEESEVVK